MDKVITARKARDILLNRSEEVITSLIDTALGLDSFGEQIEEPNLDALLEITKKMLPLIKLEDDRVKLDFPEPEQVPEGEPELTKKEIVIQGLYRMFNNGNLSTNELSQAMQILKDRFEIEELGQVLAQLELMNRKT